MMTLVVTLVVLVAAEQCLNRVKDFSASYADPSVRRLGVHQRSWVRAQTGELAKTGLTGKKKGGVGGKEGGIPIAQCPEVMAFVFPGKCYV